MFLCTNCNGVNPVSTHKETSCVSFVCYSEALHFEPDRPALIVNIRPSIEPSPLLPFSMATALCQMKTQTSEPVCSSHNKAWMIQIIGSLLANSVVVIFIILIMSHLIAFARSIDRSTHNIPAQNSLYVSPCLLRIAICKLQLATYAHSVCVLH